MMKQKRIVAVALGLALSVSPMIVLPTAFADQVSGNPSSSISARSTAPNPLDKFSAEEKASLDKITSALGIDGFDPSTTDYYGVKESSLDTVAGRVQATEPDLPESAAQDRHGEHRLARRRKDREGQAVPPATWHTGSRSRAPAAAPSHTRCTPPHRMRAAKPIRAS